VVGGTVGEGTVGEGGSAQRARFAVVAGVTCRLRARVPRTPPREAMARGQLGESPRMVRRGGRPQEPRPPDHRLL